MSAGNFIVSRDRIKKKVALSHLSATEFERKEGGNRSFSLYLREIFSISFFFSLFFIVLSRKTLVSLF